METLTVQPDPIAAEIAAAVHDLEDGRLSRARTALFALWQRVTDATAAPPRPPAAQQRAALAHWLGAVQTDPARKLAWDETALVEAEDADDWSVPFAGTATTLGAMYPELHLELARDYVAADQPCAVLEHLALARNAVDAVPEARRARLRREIAKVDRALDGRAPQREDWGWERYDEVAVADLSDTDTEDETGTDDDGAG